LQNHSFALEVFRVVSYHDTLFCGLKFVLSLSVPIPDLQFTIWGTSSRVCGEFRSIPRLIKRLL